MIERAMRMLKRLFSREELLLSEKIEREILQTTDRSKRRYLRSLYRKAKGTEQRIERAKNASH